MTVERAIELAATHHRNQRDWSGIPYIFHPLRVMLAVPDACKNVAVLHDTLEDTLISRSLLAQELTAIECDALDLVTHHKTMMSYMDYIEKIATASGPAGDIARTVKIADLRDNFGRPCPPEKMGVRKRYLKAMRRLGVEP